MELAFCLLLDDCRWDISRSYPVSIECLCSCSITDRGDTFFGGVPFTIIYLNLHFLVPAIDFGGWYFLITGDF